MHKAVDPEDEFFHAAEGSASDGLPCNPVEPDLHLVKPGRVGGREMYMEARSSGQPAFHARMFVGGVVVHDHMHIQLGGNIFLDMP
jgi:hypothetical protein